MGVLGGLAGWVLSLYATHEALGLLLFLLIEEAGVPLLFPGDVLIIAAGARPGRTMESTLIVLGSATLASTAGSSLLYALVRRGGRPLLERYGRFLHLSEGRLAIVERWADRHGAPAIVVGRLIPGLRTPTTIMAGIALVPYRTFLPATACAAVLWAAGYYAIGVFAEGPWHAMLGFVAAHARLAVAIAVTGAALVALVLTLRHRRSRWVAGEPAAIMASAPAPPPAGERGSRSGPRGS